MRCYFHLVNGGQEILDEEGLDVANLDDAKEQAALAINELRSETPDVIDDWAGWRLEIVDADGNLLFSIPLNKTLH